MAGVFTVGVVGMIVTDMIVVVVIVIGIVTGSKATVDHPNSTGRQSQIGPRCELSCVSFHRTVPCVMAIPLKRRLPLLLRSKGCNGMDR